MSGQRNPGRQEILPSPAIFPPCPEAAQEQKGFQYLLKGIARGYPLPVFRRDSIQNQHGQMSVRSQFSGTRFETLLGQAQVYDDKIRTPAKHRRQHSTIAHLDQVPGFVFQSRLGVLQQAPVLGPALGEKEQSAFIFSHGRVRRIPAFLAAEHDGLGWPTSPWSPGNGSLNVTVRARNGM